MLFEISVHETLQQLEREQQNHRRQVQTCHRWQYPANRREDWLCERVRDRDQRVAAIERYPGENHGDHDYQRIEIDEVSEERHRLIRLQ